MKKELIGYKGNIIELSNKLVSLGCEDICDFGNWDEIIDCGAVAVAIEDTGGLEHILISFDVIIKAEQDEKIEATEIKITDVERF
jgi:hypothetical protein